MEDEKREKRIAAFLLGLFLLCAFLTMCGCSPRIQYVTKIQHDSIYVNKVKTDSVYVKDSIFIDRSGDTIYKEVWRWRVKEQYVHDTTMVSKVDSVPYPVEVVKYVKKKSVFANFCIGGFMTLLALIVSYIVYCVVKRYRKQ